MKTNNLRALLLHIGIVILNWLLMSRTAEYLLGPLFTRFAGLTSSSIVFFLNIVLYVVSGRFLYKQGSFLKNVLSISSILCLNAVLWATFFVIPHSLKAPFSMLMPLLNFGIMNFFHFYFGWKLSYLIVTFFPYLLMLSALQFLGRRPDSKKHLEGFAKEDITELKKWFVLYGFILAAIISVNSFLTLPKSFDSVVKLDFKVRTISLVNGIHKAPVVKIRDRKDIDKILQLLSLGKYSRKYNYPFVPLGGGGPIFYLVLEDIAPENKIAIGCYGKGMTINKKNYVTDADITWKIAAYLMSKNLYQKAELALDHAHRNIKIISKRYGEQNPYVEDIVPGITKKFRPGTMYDVHLRGNFKNGDLQAENLYFSMQEIYPVFWDIRAADATNNTVWEKEQ